MRDIDEKVSRIHYECVCVSRISKPLEGRAIRIAVNFLLGRSREQASRKLKRAKSAGAIRNTRDSLPRDYARHALAH